METLNYKVLAQTGYDGYILKDAPIKVMQFGEGNFLRAFVDYFFDIANEKAGWNGKVSLVQPIGNFPQMADWINAQEGLYTLYLRGSEKGQKVDDKRVISCVANCVCPYSEGKWAEVLALAASPDLEIIASNTTEAGIAYTKGDSAFDQVPPNSFPAKLTRVLYERYKAFGGDAGKGLVILSCELIDNNGKELQKCCNNYAADWGLEQAFIDWMNNANTFCSTLVDRIVPGRIRDPQEMAAIEEANGYHDQVLDVGEVFGVWVIEGPAWLEDKLPFKKAGVNVMLMSISLNSTSKWKARNMPSFLEYIKEKGELPKCLTMSLAAYIAFYSSDIQERTADGLICKRPKGNTYKIQDDAWALDFYYAHKDDSAAGLVHAVLTNTQMWDQDLTAIPGVEAAVLADLELIRTQGAEAAYKSCL